MINPAHSIKVRVHSTYVEDQSSPENEQYVFAYTIIIENIGTIPAKLLTRHWIITDSNGKIREVRGDGVVGEQPYLRPGEAFRYTSAAMIETPVGSMHGSYQMIADDGVAFDAPIVAFGLSIPNLLH